MARVTELVLMNRGEPLLPVRAGSIIGANALVTMGMKIPPGSLVLGSPAKFAGNSR